MKCLNNPDLPREEVTRFAFIMENKLRVNDYKHGWKECPNDFLITKLLEESAELIWTINRGRGMGKYLDDLVDCFRQELIREAQETSRDSTELEAADVANIAMMLADNNTDEISKKGELKVT